MYQQILMPTDGGGSSLGAFGPAREIAARADAPVVVFAVIGPHERPDAVAAHIQAHLPGFDPAVHRVEVRQGVEPAAAIIAELEQVPGSLLVMRTAGRSRLEPILGLVTETVLRASTTPAVLVGPHVEADSWTLDGPVVVCTDGSATSQTMVPVAAQWGIAMGVELAVVAVSEPGAPSVGDTSDVALPARVAGELKREIGRDVFYDAVHDSNAAQAIERFAGEQGASLVAMATHGRTGLKRIAVGSTTMTVVRRANVPVLTQRPPQFAQED